MKRSLGELKKVTGFGIISPMLRCRGEKGYAQLFQQHAESILSLLQPYNEANEVKLLREEYNRILRQVQVFDQLPKPSFASTSDEGEDEKKGYYELWSSVNQNVNEFRYHSADLVSKIEKGKLKPGKPAETGQETKPVKELSKNSDYLGTYEPAKRLAKFYNLPVQRVRSELSKEFWGPGGMKANNPKSPQLRTALEDAGGKDTQYLWRTGLCKPILERLVQNQKRNT